MKEAPPNPAIACGRKIAHAINMLEAARGDLQQGRYELVKAQLSVLLEDLASTSSWLGISHEQMNTLARLSDDARSLVARAESGLKSASDGRSARKA